MNDSKIRRLIMGESAKHASRPGVYDISKDRGAARWKRFRMMYQTTTSEEICPG